MEFVEAVNPHYAFPIVGVIVCCLLVFAFGFKSPGQPPSFDIVDEERKIAKKRKGNQKVKSQQNGKVTGGVSSKSEATPHIPKAKVSVCKPENKYEPKSNKKSRSQQVTTHGMNSINANKSKIIQAEDGKEDGWVQLVSKKERKNRKKDDVSPDTTDVTKAVAEVESFVLVSENFETAHPKLDDVIEPNAKEVYVISDSAAEKEPCEDTKFIQKHQRTPKVKKGKREEVDMDINMVQREQLPSLEAHDFPLGSGLSLENKAYSPVSGSSSIAEPPVDDLLQVNEMAYVDVSEEEVKSKCKKKKSKKKNQETTTEDDMKIEINSFHAQQYNKDKEPDVCKEEIIIEPKLTAEEFQDSEDKKAVVKEHSCASGSNVAYDELKDLYQEEKPQKKKKKVRREH